MKFPRELIGSAVTQSPLGPSKVTAVGRGLPCLGFMQQHVPWCLLDTGYLFDPFDIYGSRSIPYDIARRAHALVKFLKFFGINGIEHADARPECVDEWSPDYAIIENAYSPWSLDMGDYFDEDRCREDFNKAVRQFFAGDPSVRVEFHPTDEVEIIR